MWDIKEGEVVIQTFNEENDVIKKNSRKWLWRILWKWVKFWEKPLIYPPFGRLIILNLSSTDEKLLEENSKLLYNELENKIKGNSGYNNEWIYFWTIQCSNLQNERALSKTNIHKNLAESI